VSGGYSGSSSNGRYTVALLHELLMVKHSQQLCSDIEKAAVHLVVLCDTLDLTPSDVWERYGLTAVACLSCKASLADVFQCVLDVTACQDTKNVSGGAQVSENPILYHGDGRPSNPNTAFNRTVWRPQDLSYNLPPETVIPSRTFAAPLKSTGGLRGGNFRKRGSTFAARKPYDITTQRWQSLINRFENVVRGLRPGVGEESCVCVCVRVCVCVCVRVRVWVCMIACVCVRVRERNRERVRVCAVS
jgi:hypothetical protein